VGAQVPVPRPGCIQTGLEIGTLLSKAFAELLRGPIRASVKLSRLLGA